MKLPGAFRPKYRQHDEYTCPEDGHSVLIHSGSTCFPRNILCDSCHDDREGKCKGPKRRIVTWQEMKQRGESG